MYIDKCYMSSDDYIEKYFNNSSDKMKSFIKKTYHRAITKDDYDDIIDILLKN